MVRPHPLSLLSRFTQPFRHSAGSLEHHPEFKRLKASESRFRDLYENAPLAYFTVDTDGVVQGANRRARELLEARGRSLVGTRVLNLYADSLAGRDKALALFQRFKAGLAIDDEELEMRKLSGEPVWVSLTVEPITDDAGRVVASRSAVVDVAGGVRSKTSCGNGYALTR